MRVGYDKATGQPVAYDAWNNAHAMKDLIDVVLILREQQAACEALRNLVPEELLESLRLEIGWRLALIRTLEAMAR